MVEQWGIRVPSKSGEEVRKSLMGEGILDLSLKVIRDGSTLVLPVTEQREGAERCSFELRAGRPVLPRHELVGGIAIMQENDPAGAEQILATIASLHTVLCPASDVMGEYRTRKFEVLAGIPTTRTEILEYGHRFVIDLASAYFSSRLSSERQRILGKVGDRELILDMFAGVGPFAITLAKRAALVIACDINPRAVILIQENLGKNRVKNVLPVLADAHHLPGTLLLKFDRIIMNLPLSGTAFLADAFRLCKSGGIIHFYSLVAQEGQHRDDLDDMGGEVIDERVVRSYSPGQWHVVYDVKVATR